METSDRKFGSESASGLQRVTVFQQRGSGERKIAGVRQYAPEEIQLTVVSIDDDLPAVIEDASGYLPQELDADLVLDYLTHQDLSLDLGELCRRQGIPVISSGRKNNDPAVLTPPTCCGLPKLPGLGTYGRRFGVPEFEVELEQEVVKVIRVLRGSPCGATWEAARRVEGSPAADAARRIGLDTQFYCFADPAGWDPIHGKSPVHFAGKVHSQALARAIEKARRRD